MTLIIDNKVNKLGDDLRVTIDANSKLQVCASIFSMYGFDVLKEELNKIDEMQFIFTDSTFINKAENEKQEKQFETITDGKVKYKLVSTYSDLREVISG